MLGLCVCLASWVIWTMTASALSMLLRTVSIEVTEVMAAWQERSVR